VNYSFKDVAGISHWFCPNCTTRPDKKKKKTRLKKTKLSFIPQTNNDLHIKQNKKNLRKQTGSINEDTARKIVMNM